jgi:CheY-like chemotaxis protein
LAAQHKVHLEMAMSDDLPQLATNPVAFRQTLLSLLSVAIPRASSCGRAVVSARTLLREVKIEVRCGETPSGPQSLSNDDAASINMARQLANLCGGELAFSADEESVRAVLTLPALGRFPVLAVDDNASTLQLLKRYTAGTRYHLVGTENAEQALRLVQELSPQIIVLDVMMPYVDGWEVLERLRQHPHASHIPIIVCTIIAEEGLALSLGASDFIRKPVTRKAFLAALDRQATSAETESH